MATSDLLQSLINDRNTLADNLVTMGVEATHDETFTALAPKVLEIVTGINIKSVTLNQNGTYTIVDEDDNTHTLTVVTDVYGKVTSITFDQEDPVAMTYDASGNLIKVGETDIDVDLYSAGPGEDVTDLTLNANGSYTVTDSAGSTHTLVTTATDGQITAITYDGRDIPLSFDANGNLIKVGLTDVDVSSYQ